jgi:peptidyl-tRNA hydrolase
MAKKRATQSEIDKYKRQFLNDILNNVPHHAAIKMAKAIKSDKLVQYGYRSRQEELSKMALKVYSEQEVTTYTKALQEAKLWHGTGRYQHNGSETQDVLSQIIISGGLKPVPDSYAVILGGRGMASISATRIRIVARCYADIHGKGELEANRYGSSLWWLSYYCVPFFVQIFTKNAINMARNYKKWHQATSNIHGERTWGKKVNKNAKRVWDVFGLGSDIPGNYPILVGIKGQVDTALLPDAIAKTEVRFTHLVSMSDFTHLEVPEEKVSETEMILTQAKLPIPVFPIELGEYVASKQSIAELLST